MSARDWAVAALLVLVSLLISYHDWNGWKIAKEFANLGLPRFVFQYVYYAAETLLILHLVGFGQKAGEMRFGHPNVPWGGLLTGLTWGLAHALTKGQLSMGILSFFGGVLFGAAYLTARKSAWRAYFLIALMFIL